MCLISSHCDYYAINYLFTPSQYCTYLSSVVHPTCPDHVLTSSVSPAPFPSVSWTPLWPRPLCQSCGCQQWRTVNSQMINYITRDYLVAGLLLVVLCVWCSIYLLRSHGLQTRICRFCWFRRWGGFLQIR